VFAFITFLSFSTTFLKNLSKPKQSLVIMAFMACSSLGCIASSHISKHYLGKKQIAIVAYLISGVFYFIFILSTDFLFVMFCTCVMFFCTFGALTAYTAFCAVAFPTEIRGTAMGFIGICSRLGGISAPFIAGFILNNLNSENVVVAICGIAEVISPLFLLFIPNMNKVNLA
jgi:MFS family permease